MRFADKVTLVTGAARGLGFACARRFAEEGSAVFLADIDEVRLANAEAELRAEGADVHSAVVDVSSCADITRMMHEVINAYGRLDIVVNNAGIAITKDFMAITEEDFDRVIGINLRGAFFVLKAAARWMIDHECAGIIINMSSINSRMANPSVATYAISKGGLNQVTTTAAVGLARHGIRVVGIGPGTIDTDMLKMGFLTSKEQEKMILSRTPAGRLGQPEEIAGVAAFLASDDASYMTGQTVYPDGGRMILNYVMPE